MNIIKKMFGTHSERELKRIYSTVDKIEALRPTMQALTDEELRGKTREYKTDLEKRGKLWTASSGSFCNRKRGCKACSWYGALPGAVNRWYHSSPRSYCRDENR